MIYEYIIFFKDKFEYNIAIIADGGMMILASLVASYLAGQSLNANIIVMIALVYALPYLLYN
jgi:hypothetical protein